MKKTKEVKLYEIPRGSRILARLDDGRDASILFHRTDGMYSYCTIEGTDEQVVHLGVMTPLEKMGDHYIIKR